MKTKQVLVWALALLGVMILFTSSPLLAEEKTMTPLGGGEIPLIEGIKMLEVGAEAPNFVVKDIEGKPFDFSKHKGKKVYLLVFWSIFCEPCRYEMPIIEKIYEEMGGDDFEVIAVAIDGEPMKNAIAGFVKQEKFTFTVLIDELDEKEFFKVADPYGVPGTPTLYIVNREGKISFGHAGRLTKKELVEQIKKALGK